MSRLALVIDDSMLIRHTVCRFLEERGFTVESASSGKDALILLDSVTPDIIITDLAMPKMSGEELIATLRSRPQTAQVPIVILASRASGPHKAEEKNANYVIYKDIDIETQLQKTIIDALGNGMTVH